MYQIKKSDVAVNAKGVYLSGRNVVSAQQVHNTSFTPTDNNV